MTSSGRRERDENSKVVNKHMDQEGAKVEKLSADKVCKLRTFEHFFSFQLFPYG